MRVVVVTRLTLTISEMLHGHGFATMQQGALWPLLQYMVEQNAVSAREWPCYKSVLDTGDKVSVFQSSCSTPAVWELHWQLSVPALLLFEYQRVIYRIWAFYCASSSYRARFLCEGSISRLSNRYDGSSSASIH